MANLVSIDDPFRIGKAYTIGQAAILANVPPRTVRNWLYGSIPVSLDLPEPEERPTFGKPVPVLPYGVEPVFGERPKPSEIAMVSFLELSEIIIVARYRGLKIKLQRVRDAHEYARKEWGLEHPFAHLNLRSIGGHLLARFEEQQPSNGNRAGHLVVLSSPGQYVLPHIVQEELEHFDYSDEDKFATRWHPYGHDLPVVVDPRFAGGRPTIEGRGVTVDMLYRRWTVGHQDFRSIAHDFRLKPEVVEAVLQRVA